MEQLRKQEGLLGFKAQQVLSQGKVSASLSSPAEEEAQQEGVQWR